MADQRDRISYDRQAARARLSKRQSERSSSSRERSDYSSSRRSSNYDNRYSDHPSTSRTNSKRTSGSGRSESDGLGRVRVVGGRGFETHSSSSSKEKSFHAPYSAKSNGNSLVGNALSWAGNHPRAVIIAMVVLLLAVCIGLAANSCTLRKASKQAAEEQAAYEKQSELIEGEINLPPSLDPQIESALKTAAQTNTDVNWIIRHTDQLSVDGDKVLKKLLKLTAKENSAVSFVRNFPEKYPQTEGEPYTDKVKKGEIPKLYQWDQRWGYTVYSSTAFGLTGCCPTSFSMVYMGLTGQADMTPYDMGVLADEMGYMDAYSGTSDVFLYEAASRFDMNVNRIAVSSTSLSSSLNQGCVVICNVGPGDFTEGGHYLVITGIDKDGMLSINDPYSVVNSEMKWDIDVVIDQTKGLWAYSL